MEIDNISYLKEHHKELVLKKQKLIIQLDGILEQIKSTEFKIENFQQLKLNLGEEEQCQN